MQFPTRYALLALTLLLASCARPPLIPQIPASSRICCKSFQAMQTGDLKFEDTTSVSFDAETSPVFPFPEGNGVFAAYTLPQQSDGALLELRAFVSGGPALTTMTIVRANALFLDAARNPLPGPREAPLRTRRGILAWSMSKIATYTVPNSARYVIVYSGSPYAERTTFSSENGTEYGLPYSYSGKVDVSLRSAK
ncbi:hypothetical protein [Cupriavidus sp. 2SB]|uniref:hypothetical protein n=1 Tax=unclassified Cupriavidus TaxID=2640874 RepID=UPI0010F5C11C|nr:hypothetical protein [Cupriavidus sp. 2SB]